jgi:hypothetical protein
MKEKLLNVKNQLIAMDPTATTYAKELSLPAHGLPLGVSKKTYFFMQNYRVYRNENVINMMINMK